MIDVVDKPTHDIDAVDLVAMNRGQNKRRRPRPLASHHRDGNLNVPREKGLRDFEIDLASLPWPYVDPANGEAGPA
jgi:hypothetical protein